MKNDIFRSVSSVIFPKDQKSRTQLYVFLVCLALSLFIWLIIKLSQEFIYEIEFPVKVTGIPEGKILVSGQDQYLTVGFEEKFSELFYLRFIRKKDPIALPAGNMTTRTKGDVTTGIIHPSLLSDYIKRQIELEYNMVSLSPDSLKFVFEKRKTKTVQVVSQLEILPGKQRMLYDSIQLDPGSVMISGPASEIDSIFFLALDAETIGPLDDSLKIERKLRLPDDADFVTVKPTTISITIPIEEYTEANTEVTIIPQSSNYNQIKTFPESAMITYWIALSDYHKVDPSLFSVVADVDSAQRMGFRKAPLALKKRPGFIRNPRIEPDRVEYIIIRP